jgi:hypothetical protein
MPGPGQSDLQILSSKTVDMTRLQYQQDITNRATAEAIQSQSVEKKELEKSQVLKEEGSQKVGDPRHNRRQRQQHPEKEQNTQQPAEEARDQARQLGYGNRFDLTV